jgi:CubicO group peptidase (beta-lactamase class C family)
MNLTRDIQRKTHTAGIPHLKNPPTTLPATPEEVIALYNDVPLDFPAGTKYEYSNEGYQALGYVIERVSGQSYA